MSGMGRREFVALVGSAAAWPLSASAQQPPERMRRIGIIDDAPMWNAFRQGLREHGYLEGQNIAFDYKYADGVPERLAKAAAELVRRPVDLIATYGTPPSRAAKDATATIPIVMIAVGDPVRADLVASIARPGGNVTGNTILGPEVGAKRLQLFKEAVPTISRMAFLVNPANASTVAYLEELQITAPALGVELISAEVGSVNDFDSAFAAIMRERPDAFMMTAAPHQARRRLPDGQPATEHFPESGQCSCWRTYVLRSEPVRSVPARRGIRAQDITRDQARKPPRRTAD